jgi:hypothetical protein
VNVEGGELVLRHAPDVLDQVENLLQEMATHRDRLVTCKVRFFHLEPQHLSDLEMMSPIDGGLGGTFDRSELNDLAARWKQRGVMELDPPNLTLFPGQFGQVIISNDLAYTAGWSRATEVPDPQVAVCREGLNVQLGAVIQGMDPEEILVHFGMENVFLAEPPPSVLPVSFHNNGNQKLTVELPGCAKSCAQGLFRLCKDQSLLIVMRNFEREDRKYPLLGAIVEAQIKTHSAER